MHSGFNQQIKPFVEKEYQLALQARSREDASAEFKHLESAHVLGQLSTYWHTRTHFLMLRWSVRNGQKKEFFGQLLRLVGAVAVTSIGMIPQGNTGGANVSPFKPMPLKSEHADIIQNARQSR